MENSAASVCFIAPRLPPAIDGIGDYCRQLWEHYLGAVTQITFHRSDTARPRPRWKFLVTEGALASAECWPEVDIGQFDMSRAGLLSALEAAGPTVVVLQYVGYGYDRNGSPDWLPEALCEWLARRGTPRRLIVMFHETWARGMPWQRAFWQQARQRHCAERLLSLATIAVTSTEANLRDLRSLAPDKPLKLIPIGASFPVLPARPKNWHQWLVFGREAARLRALRMHGYLMERAAREGVIERVVLAGECMHPSQDAGRRVLEAWGLPCPVECAFNFSGHDLPEVVLNSGISLMHTQSTYLLKSTSFLLAAGLGQVAVTRQEREPGQGLVAGTHYLSYRPGTVAELIDVLSCPERLEPIAGRVAVLGSTTLSW
ncbi:MAG TPA: hypothetical protein V6D08_09860, partial [Candidatus Obscuribacterales bacterium]